jgi:hypothetical protein
MSKNWFIDTHRSRLVPREAQLRKSRRIFSKRRSRSSNRRPDFTSKPSYRSVKHERMAYCRPRSANLIEVISQQVNKRSPPAEAAEQYTGTSRVNKSVGLDH